jgi:hypothetical protein
VVSYDYIISLRSIKICIFFASLFIICIVPNPQLQNYYDDVAHLGSATFTAAESATDYLCETDDGSGNLYDIDTAAATRGECHAQYVINHQFEFKYGDLPHFQPGYVGCDICESVIAIVGLNLCIVY